MMILNRYQLASCNDALGIDIESLPGPSVATTAKQYDGEWYQTRKELIQVLFASFLGMREASLLYGVLPGPVQDIVDTLVQMDTAISNGAKPV